MRSIDSTDINEMLEGILKLRESIKTKEDAQLYLHLLGTHDKQGNLTDNYR